MNTKYGYIKYVIENGKRVIDFTNSKFNDTRSLIEFLLSIYQMPKGC